MQVAGQMSYVTTVVTLKDFNMLTSLELKTVKAAHTRLPSRVPELIPVLGSQPASDARLSARPAVTPATLKRAATNFAAW